MGFKKIGENYERSSIKLEMKHQTVLYIIDNIFWFFFHYQATSKTRLNS